MTPIRYERAKAISSFNNTVINLTATSLASPCSKYSWTIGVTVFSNVSSSRGRTTVSYTQFSWRNKFECQFHGLKKTKASISRGSYLLRIVIGIFNINFIFVINFPRCSPNTFTASPTYEYKTQYPFRTIKCFGGTLKVTTCQEWKEERKPCKSFSTFCCSKWKYIVMLNG